MRRPWLLLGARLCLLAALLIGVGQFAVSARRRVRAIKADLAAVETDSRRARLRLEQLTARARSGPLAVVPPARVSVPPASGRFVGRDEPAAQSSSPRFEHPVDFFAAHPDFETLYLRRLRAGVATEFGAFFRNAGLSPTQIERFEDLMQSHGETLTDLLTAARIEGESNPDQLIQPLANAADRQLAAGLRELLGDPGYAQLQQYETTAIWRNQVDTVAGQLYETAAPLTLTQANQLTEIMAHDLGSPQLVQGVTLLSGEPNYTAALAHAQTLLSGPQLAAFQSNLEKIQLLAELGQQQLPSFPKISAAPIP